MIGGSALLLAILGGVLAGIFAALRQNRPGDYAVMAVSTVGVTVPNFVVAPILQLVFGLGLAWLPVGGWGDGSLRYRVLPVIALALPQMAVIARLMRGSLIEVLRADHVRTARAYGLPRPRRHRRACAAGGAVAGAVLSRPGRRRAAHRLGGDREDLLHPRRRHATSSTARSTATTRW